MQQLIMKRIAELQEELNQLKDQAEQEKKSSWDKLDPLADGSVIVFDKKFGVGKTYTYAAIKKNDLWFLTNTGGKTHADLAAFLDRTPYVIHMRASTTLYRTPDARKFY